MAGLPGVYVDFINLHTNAGTSSGDETARENEWTQLTSWIAANVPAGDGIAGAAFDMAYALRVPMDLSRGPT